MRLRLLVRCVKFLVIASAAFPLFDAMAEPQPTTAPTAPLAKYEEMLRKAGASPDILSKFEEDMRKASAEERARTEEYLSRQSPEMLTKLVENIRYDDQYVLGPDSRAQSGVPKGQVFEFKLDHSKVFPGTTRKIKVYIPAEYRGDKPACVYVGFDDLLFEVPTVFDNLIYKHEMPITIAIGVSPGEVASAAAPEDPRFNRSFEFDSLNGNLDRFLVEEVFPEVEQHKTSEGLQIRLSKNPDDRAAGGVSTGGIASFTLAWEHPEDFRRVFVASGTFVGMRGGDRYAVLVRKTEPKPIRIFMQDGSHDGMDGFLGEAGDWWMSNQAMQRALEFSGYQVRHVWGDGPHGSKQGAAVFPESMRWLWKDWPQPISTGESKNVFLKEILDSGQNWQVVSGPYKSAGVVASDSKGAISFRDAASGKTWVLSNSGKMSESFVDSRSYSAMAFGPDGRSYVAEQDHAAIVAYGTNGKSSIVGKNIRGANLVVSYDGMIYVTEAGGDDNSGKVWLLKPNGERLQLDGGLNHPSAVALSPDGLWLAVAENRTHWGYSYRVQPDGSVQEKQRFYWFHDSDEADGSGASSLAMDREGRLYAATHMGVQVFDRNGRVRAILPVPGGEVTGLAFGGTDFKTLYVTCVDKRLYLRHLKISGVSSSAPPIKLPSSDDS